MGGKGFSSTVVMTNIEHPEKTVQLLGCMHKICQHKERKMENGNHKILKYNKHILIILIF